MKKTTKRKIHLWMTLLVLLFAGIIGKSEVSAQSAALQSLVLVVPKAGFNPSSGNYILIKTGITSDVKNQKLRVRVVNSQGNYVFQKTVTGLNGDSYSSIKWNGKAIKNNSAKVKTGSYVSAGTYRVEALLYYTGSNGKKVYHKKVKSLKISKSAPSGTAAHKKAVTVPILTGDSEVDYLAELMVKAAGVTTSMTQDQKVKKIYHWITVNFHHEHYSLGDTDYTIYYDTDKLASKIKSYRKTCDTKIKNGTMIYNYYSPYHILWNMQRRIGVCSDHARVFKILCNHVGVEAEVCSGKYINRSGSTPTHSWNLAVIDGVTWYYDVDVELQNYGKGQGDYYWYKKTRAEAEKTHIFEN